jgi:hypothetical protein
MIRFGEEEVCVMALAVASGNRFALRRDVETPNMTNVTLRQFALQLFFRMAQSGTQQQLHNRMDGMYYDLARPTVVSDVLSVGARAWITYLARIIMPIWNVSIIDLSYFTGLIRHLMLGFCGNKTLA